MRVLLLVVLVIAALAAVAFWQRDRIETLLRAQKAEWEHDRAVSAMGAERLDEVMTKPRERLELEDERERELEKDREIESTRDLDRGPTHGL